VTSSHLDSPALGSTAASAAVEVRIDQPVLDVLDIATAAGVDALDAIAVAGALQAGSPHPVAVAIAAYAAEQAQFWPAMDGIDRIDELGVVGDTGAREALLGSPALLAAHGITLPDELTSAVVDAAITGDTPLVLAWNGQARAVLVVGETARAEADLLPEPVAPAPRHTATWTVVTILAVLAAVAGLRQFR
jgi:hypothetical protein